MVINNRRGGSGTACGETSPVPVVDVFSGVVTDWPAFISELCERLEKASDDAGKERMNRSKKSEPPISIFIVAPIINVEPLHDIFRRCRAFSQFTKRATYPREGTQPTGAGLASAFPVRAC
jgi:hypothetical protein